MSKKEMCEMARLQMGRIAYALRKKKKEKGGAVSMS